MNGRDTTTELGDFDQEPPRWSEDAASEAKSGAASGAPSDDLRRQQRIAALWRKLPPPAELPAARLHAVRVRLREPSMAMRARGLRPWAWALAALLLLLGSGVVAAARGWVPWVRLRPVESTSAPARAALAAARPRHRSAREMNPSNAVAPAMLGSASVPEPAAPPPEPQAEPPAALAPAAPAPGVADPPTVDPPAAVAPRPISARPRPGRSPSVVSTPVAPIAPVAVTTVAPADPAAPPAQTEASALEAAVVTLRRQGDARAALQMLDRYDDRYAQGVLAQEADRLRVDAWLVLGDRRRALRQLNQLTMSDGARDLELLLIRGELRAALAGCAGAADDFARVLAVVSDPALRARARAGSAACARAGAAGAR